MTNVRFSITRETLTGREQVGGVIEARPSARRNLATEVVLPDAVRIVLTAGEDAPVVDLEPTTSQWVWRIIERVEKGAHGSRFLAVPDTEDTVEYVDLVEVDPASLDPLPSVPSVADALADKADLVEGAVPDEQLPERLSDTSLSATIATVAVGRSAATFGIGPTRTAAENRTGFLAAIAWAQGAKENESRTLVIPPMGAGEYIDLAEHVRLPAGFRLLGSGAESRIRTITKPEPAFIATGAVDVRGIAFHGLDDRAIPNGTFGTHRENWDAINYSGILLLSGSDGSVLRDIYGKNLGCAIAAWGWDEDAEEYAGNIQGLDIANVYAEGVWVGVFWREVDFMDLHNVFVKDYAPPGDNSTGDFAAPPHGIYATSSSSLAEARPMFGNVISRIRVKGGRYGSAVSFKHMVGAQISDIAARDCEGLMDVNSMRDSSIRGVSGIGDVGDRAGTDLLAASVNVRLSENTRISDINVRQAEAATARLLLMADDNTDDVIVEKFSGRSVYATSAVQELALVRGGQLLDADLKHEGVGVIGRGIRVDQGSARVRNPKVSGVSRPLFVDGGATLDVQYEKADLISTNANGEPRIYPASGATLVEPRRSPDDSLLVWGEAGCFGLDDGTWMATASGHTVTRLTGFTWQLNQSASGAIKGWVRTQSSTSNGIAYVDAGAANVDVSILTRCNSDTDAFGIALRVLDASNYLTVELRSTGVYLCAVIGGTKSDIASYLFTRIKTRIYSVRAVAFGANVSVYIDGTERISNASVGTAPQSTLGNQTKHGLYHHLSTSGHTLLQSIRALS